MKLKHRKYATKSPVTLSALGVALVVLIVPLMQGGLVTATLPLCAFLVALALLAEVWRVLFRDGAAWRDLAPWIYLWVAVSFYIFAQPGVREILDTGLELNGNRLTGTYWLQQIKYWSFFTAYLALAWIVSRQTGRARDLLLIAVIAIAVFESLYGMLAFTNGQETILGIWPKVRFHDSVTGTFFNRNHLAGFLAVAMPLGVSFVLSRQWEPAHHSVPVIKICITMMYLLITGAALLGTASRLGIFSAMIGFMLWGWLYQRTDLAGNRFRRLCLVLLVLIPVLAGLWFGPGRLIERLLTIDQATGRIEIWRAMLGAPAEVWIHGIGAGQFQDVFKLISPVGLLPSMWRAHNEYLQVVFELGLVGCVLLIPFFVFWIKRSWPKQLDGIQRGALAGVIAVMVHNIADFDLQVPGTAVLFWVALGILFSVSPAETRAVLQPGQTVERINPASFVPINARMRS